MADLREYEVLAKTRAFARHVDTAKRIVERAYSLGEFAASSSWGKDSVAMCGLIYEVVGRHQIFHMASPYGLPGYEETVRHFSERCDITTLNAKRTLAEYIEMCRNIGLPHERTRVRQKSVVKDIKRDPGQTYAEENGLNVIALGMRMTEKGPREKMLKAKGPTYRLRSGTWRTNPLAYWTSKDVWSFIVSRGLPYNHRIYDAETHGFTRENIRNTGWLSTDSAENGRISWLKEHFPEQYGHLVAEFPHLRYLV